MPVLATASQTKGLEGLGCLVARRDKDTDRLLKIYQGV